MEHRATFEQVGSTGTVLVETNFGFSCLLDYIKTPKIYSVGGKKVAVPHARRRNRVITVLSYCHGSPYERNPGKLKCKICGKEPPLSDEYVTREYPVFDEEALRVVSLILAKSKIDYLDSVFVADQLTCVIEKLWSRVAGGERIRSILSSAPFYSTVEL